MEHDHAVFAPADRKISPNLTRTVLYQLPHEYPQYRCQVDLIPDLDSPKDLYGGTLGGRRRARLRKAA